VHSSQSATKFLLDDEDLGETVANDIFDQKLNFGGDKLDYDITGEEYGNALDQYQNVRYATFFDLLEDNMIDMIVVTDNGSGRRINAIYNNIDKGNFFLKTRMITDEGTYSPVRGAAIRAVVTMLSDKKIIV